MDSVVDILNSNEATISAIVSLMTLAAAAWGAIQLAVIPLLEATFRSSDDDKSASALKPTNPLSALLNRGLDPLAELDEQIAVRTLNLSLLAMAGFSLTWLVATLISPTTVILTIINFIVFSLAVSAFNLSSPGRLGLARWLLLFDMALYWVTNIVVMGAMNGLEYFLTGLVLVPLLLFRREESRQQYLAIGLFIGALLLSLFLQSALEYRVPASEAFISIGYYVNAAFLAVMVCLIINFYNNVAANSFSELEEQELKSEELVKSILPEYIATKISNNETMVADWHKEATVLFATVYGFESLYRRVSATQLVELLSQVFVEFDHLVTEHGVEKVNSLGTNYVAATGIGADENADHESLALVALGMRDVISKLSAAVDHSFRLRVGICTGDVISGVIGEARPSYDVWGETVELANSMREAALDNTIVVNEAARWRLREQFELSALSSDVPSYLLERAR